MYHVILDKFLCDKSRCVILHCNLDEGGGEGDTGYYLIELRKILKIGIPFLSVIQMRCLSDYLRNLTYSVDFGDAFNINIGIVQPQKFYSQDQSQSRTYYFVHAVDINIIKINKDEFNTLFEIHKNKRHKFYD